MSSLSDASVIDGGQGEPPAPDWTKIFKLKVDRDIAAELWRGVISEMRTNQTLAAINGPAIKRLIIFQVEFERQARAIGKGGVIRKAARTKVPQVHPSWSVMKQAAEIAGTLEAELGISPRRRNNAGKVQRKERAARPSDRFLKPVA